MKNLIIVSIFIFMNVHYYSTEPTVLSYDYGNFPSMGFTLDKEFISWNDAVSSIEIINN